MTLEKAITELQGMPRGTEVLITQKREKALRLGIEALKQMKAERTIYGFKRHVRMPGETEE